MATSWSKYTENKIETPKINIYMPCFSCNYAYICKYFKNPGWTDWILNYKACPLNYMRFYTN